MKTYGLGPQVWQDGKARKVNFVKSRQAKIPDFLEAEEMGTVVPKRCLR